MTKATITIFFVLQFSIGLKSQDTVNLYYNSKWQITNKEQAIYHRIAEYDLNDFKINGKVIDFYSSDTLLMTGNYSNGNRNGLFTFYYNNGKIESEGKYVNNNRIGNWKYFYPDGHLKQIIFFPDHTERFQFALLEYYDSKGNHLLKNGTGTWTIDSTLLDAFNEISYKKIVCQFKDSLMHGKWEIVRISDNVVLVRERFRKGKYKGGSSLNPQGFYKPYPIILGTNYPDDYLYNFKNTENFIIDTIAFPQSLVYSDVETIFKTITGKEFKIKNRKAGYVYGDYSLFEFIAENLQYPISAIQNKISGRVFVNIVVDSKGNVKEIGVLRGLQNDLDIEAIRVVKLINDWLPEIKDGKPIESTITIPIKFEIE